MLANRTIKYDRSKYIGRAQNLDLYGVCVAQTKKDHLIDTEGNSYIDLLSSACSLTLGYEREDLIKAYSDQCLKVPHTCTVYTFSPVIEEYAKKLIETTKIPNAKMLFGAFGSDVVDGAMKCAHAFTGKKGIIAFQKSYHGGTFLSLASSGFDGLKTHMHLPEYITHLPYPTKEKSKKTLQEIEAILKQGDTAALLMETILGDGGVLMPDSEFIQNIKDLLHHHGAILIFDEIQSGMGRTGKFWAYENFDVLPDLFCAAKGLGAGYAVISALLGRAEVIDALENCQHAFTLAGHAASSAVALRVLEAIEEEKIMENVIKINQIFHQEFAELNKSKYFHELRGLGLMLGLSLDHKKAIGPHIGRICLKNGIYLGYYGENNNVLRVQPALTISEQAAIKASRQIVNAVMEFEQNEEQYLQDAEVPSFFTS